MTKLRHILFLVLITVLAVTGCQNLRPSQAPDVRLEGAHDFGATRVAVSPDGRWLASGGHQGDIKLWTMPDGKLVKRAFKHYSPLRGVAFMDDNSLVSVTEAGDLVMWRLPQLQPAARIKLGKSHNLAVSRTQKRIYVAQNSGALSVFDARALEKLSERRFAKPVNAVAVSDKNARIVMAVGNTLVLLDANTLATLQEQNVAREVLSVRFDASGRFVVAGTWFKMARWDLQQDALTLYDTEHLGAIIDVDVHPSTAEVVSLGRHTDANLRLTSLGDGRVIRRLAAHQWCGYAVRFSPDGRYVVSASEDESIRIYDISQPYRPVFNTD